MQEGTARLEVFRIGLQVVKIMEREGVPLSQICDELGLQLSKYQWVLNGAALSAEEAGRARIRAGDEVRGDKSMKGGR